MKTLDRELAEIIAAQSEMVDGKLMFYDKDVERLLGIIEELRKEIWHLTTMQTHSEVVE